MNGVELVKRVRDSSFKGKIVVLSAHLSAENRAAYVALDVDLLIPKPFDVQSLRAAIRQLGDNVVTNPPQTAGLGAGEVYRLLQLGLPETEEPTEPETR
jgi:DNA-binding response OmpR family regulator